VVDYSIYTEGFILPIDYILAKLAAVLNISDNDIPMYYDIVTFFNLL